MKLHSTLIFAAALVACAALTGQANASVVIQFEEIGNNVVAKTTGSFLVPTTTPYSTTSTDEWASADYCLYSITDGYSDWWGGTYLATGLIDSFFMYPATGDTFGYIEDRLMLPIGLTPGSLYTPETTWVWENATLADIGLGYLSTTPLLIYTASIEAGADSISFVAVPEPSAVALLIGTAAAALVFARRRQCRRSKTPE